MRDPVQRPSPLHDIIDPKISAYHFHIGFADAHVEGWHILAVQKQAISIMPDRKSIVRCVDPQ